MESSTQTNDDLIQLLLTEVETLKNEVCNLKMELKLSELNTENLNDHSMLILAGFSLNQFNAIHVFLDCIEKQKLLIFLVRLKTGMTESVMAHFFKQSQSSISRTITSVTEKLYAKIASVSIWPSKDMVLENMPYIFRLNFPQCRVIIDCTEFAIQKPSDPKEQQQTFSNYKNTNKTVHANYEEMKEAEKLLRPPDGDSWMDITPEVLDSMLEKMSHQTPEATVAKCLTGGLKSFVHAHSDIEGVELPLCNPKNKKQKINFDPDAFTDAVNKILDFRIPHSDDDASSSSMSGYTDDDDDDVTLEEGSKGKYNTSSKEKALGDMEEYMDQMDRELAQTNIGLSFEKLPPSAVIEDETVPLSDINDEDDDFRPIDVNLTALKNLLESYSSQQGLPGPVSNLFSSMGVEVPDNLDS